MVVGDSCGAVGRVFSLRPSVGTWLQPLHHGGECMGGAVSNTAVQPLETQAVIDLLAFDASAFSPSESNERNSGFARRPSVGTWLHLRVVEIEQDHESMKEEEKSVACEQFCDDFVDKLSALEFADARALSWQADFGAFALCPPGHKSLVDDDFCDFTMSLPELEKCSDSTPIHKIETVICDNSPLGPFRLAPPPSPATDFSVGSVSPKKGVVIFEDSLSQCAGFSLEKSATLIATNETEVGIPMGDDDDEELLLGCETLETNACIANRNKSRRDDMDSASESEAEAPELLPVERQSDRRSLEASPEPEAQLSTNLFPALADSASGRASHFPEQALESAEGSLPCKAIDPPQVPQRSMKDIDSMLSESLDRFFGNDRLWGQVGREVALGTRALGAHLTTRTSHFLVQVPKPYPGVQYRQSKNLDHRHPRFAENGSVVVGRVEDGGAWLRISDDIFLPMRVGAVCIMVPLPPDPNEEQGRLDDEHPASTDRNNALFCGAAIGWWPCCSAQQNCGTADTELVVDKHDMQNSSAHAELGAVYYGQQDGCAGEMFPIKPEPLPEAVSHDPLSHVDTMCRHFSQRIDPFSDSDLGHTPSKMRMSMSPGPRRSPSTAGRGGKSDDKAEAAGGHCHVAEGMSGAAVADVFEA